MVSSKLLSRTTEVGGVAGEVDIDFSSPVTPTSAFSSAACEIISISWMDASRNCSISLFQGHPSLAGHGALNEVSSHASKIFFPSSVDAI